MTDIDKEYLYDCVRLITYELALRFFADYLAGGVYFKIRHDGQNLHRARVQTCAAPSRLAIPDRSSEEDKAVGWMRVSEVLLLGCRGSVGLWLEIFLRSDDLLREKILACGSSERMCPRCGNRCGVRDVVVLSAWTSLCLWVA